jgi:hypothetical protein
MTKRMKEEKLTGGAKSGNGDGNREKGTREMMFGSALATESTLRRECI